MAIREASELLMCDQFRAVATALFIMLPISTQSVAEVIQSQKFNSWIVEYSGITNLPTSPAHYRYCSLTSKTQGGSISFGVLSPHIGNPPNYAQIIGPFLYPTKAGTGFVHPKYLDLIVDNQIAVSWDLSFGGFLTPPMGDKTVGIWVNRIKEEQALQSGISPLVKGRSLEVVVNYRVRKTADSETASSAETVKLDVPLAGFGDAYGAFNVCIENMRSLIDAARKPN